MYTLLLYKYKKIAKSISNICLFVIWFGMELSSKMYNWNKVELFLKQIVK